MFAYLIKIITQILFEPIAVGAALGILCTFLFLKKKTAFFWIITFSVLFMLGWRIACQSVMVSSRYFSIFLLPALILTALFFFQLESFYLRIIKSYWTDNKSLLVKSSWIIPCFLVFGISIASLIKVFHFNPNASGIIKTCQVYMKDRVRTEPVYTYEVNGTEQLRIQYYADIKNHQELNHFFADQLTKELESFFLFLQDWRNIPSVFYFFYFRKNNEKDLQLPEEILSGGEWRKICRFSTSRNQKKEIVLFRYIPYCNNIELWEKEIPPLSQDNLCINGGFEQYLTGKEMEDRIAYYKEIGAADFYTDPKRLFPQGWWLGVSKPINGISSDMALTAEKPVAGKYSMEIKSNDFSGTSGINCASFPKQDCFLTGFIRALKNSTITIYLCNKNTKENNNSISDKFIFNVLPGKTYKISFQIFEKNIPEQADKIYIVIQCSGHVLIDNIEIIPSYILPKAV